MGHNGPRPAGGGVDPGSEERRCDVCDHSVEGEVNDGETETDTRKRAPGLQPDFGRAFAIN